MGCACKQEKLNFKLPYCLKCKARILFHALGKIEFILSLTRSVLHGHIQMTNGSTGLQVHYSVAMGNFDRRCVRTFKWPCSTCIKLTKYVPVANSHIFHYV